MSDLKPCPFCGCDNPYPLVRDVGGYRHGIQCLNWMCAATITAENPKDATERWNRRTPEPKEDV